MTVATSRGYLKAEGDDEVRGYGKTDLADTLDLIDADMTTALAGSGGGGGVNLLTNPGFEIKQRTASPITADLAYAHDRWQIDLGGTSTISVTDETTIVDVASGHSLKAVYTHGSAVSLLDQKLEDYLQLRGTTVTFAVRDRKGVASSVRPYIDASGSKTYGATSATTGAFETLSVTLAIPSNATSVRVGVELSVSDTVYLDNATLAVGAAALEYVPLHPADDLLRCQRYYEVLFGVNDQGLRGYQSIGEYIQQASAYKATKAVAPTVTKNGTWGVSNASQPAAIATGGRDMLTIWASATATGGLYAIVNGSDDTFVSESNP